MEKLPNLNQKTILVVEDEERNWLLIKDVIEMCNGQAIWAESGMQAIDIIADQPEIKMVLMDIQLPFMSGIETTKKIREVNKELPIIAQTAFGDPELLHKCTKAGCNKFLLKPLVLNEMYSVFNDFLC